MSIGTDDLTTRLIRLRRTIHADPEIGLRPERTQARILAELDGLDIDIHTGRSVSSVVAVLRADAARRDAPPVLLRADMDALPLTEASGVDYASTNPHAAHACGHDLHVAMLVGAIHRLAAARDHVTRDVIFVFQPGEEGHDGARHMLDEGLLEVAGDRPGAAFALHVAATAPAGLFVLRAGPTLAGSGTLRVTFRGAGGHGAWPHRARDPIPALGLAIGALQTMVTRRFDALDPVIVSIGVVQAGTAANIVPETATLEATIRAFDTDTRTAVLAEATRVCQSVAAASGVSAEVDTELGYPPTVNDPGQVAVARTLLRDLVGEDRVIEADRPNLVSDDFGRILAEVPGAMITLGARPPGLDPHTAAGNHSPAAVFDDAVIDDGVHAFVTLAIGSPLR
ncbi:MAG: M20 family metallopeptidase [Gordonia sp. (in: high G+C Gram-positive bacteria)]